MRIEPGWSTSFLLPAEGARFVAHDSGTRLAPVDTDSEEPSWVRDPEVDSVGAGLMGVADSALVVLTPGTGAVVAYDRETSETLWSDVPLGEAFRLAAVGPGHVGIVDFDHGAVLIHDASTGEVVASPDARVEQRPAVAAGRYAYVATGPDGSQLVIESL